MKKKIFLLILSILVLGTPTFAARGGRGGKGTGPSVRVYRVKTNNANQSVRTPPANNITPFSVSSPNAFQSGTLFGSGGAIGTSVNPFAPSATTVNPFGANSTTVNPFAPGPAVSNPFTPGLTAANPFVNGSETTNPFASNGMTMNPFAPSLTTVNPFASAAVKNLYDVINAYSQSVVAGQPSVNFSRPGTTTSSSPYGQGFKSTDIFSTSPSPGTSPLSGTSSPPGTSLTPFQTGLPVPQQ